MRLNVSYKVSVTLFFQCSYWIHVPMYYTPLKMYFHAMNATITINDITYFPHKAQYHFLHLALSEALMLSTSAMPASRFIDAYNELMKYDAKTKCSKMEREFQVVVLTGICY